MLPKAVTSTTGHVRPRVVRAAAKVLEACELLMERGLAPHGTPPAIARVHSLPSEDARVSSGIDAEVGPSRSLPSVGSGHELPWRFSRQRRRRLQRLLVSPAFVQPAFERTIQHELFGSRQNDRRVARLVRLQPRRWNVELCCESRTPGPELHPRTLGRSSVVQARSFVCGDHLAGTTSACKNVSMHRSAP